MHQDPEEKAVTPQEPGPDLPTGLGKPPGEVAATHPGYVILVTAVFGEIL